jgi:hypothetical protein
MLYILLVMTKNELQNSSLSYSKGLFLSSCIIWWLLFFYVLSQYEPYSFGKYDPGWMISTTQSLVEDLDLDLKNQLEGDPSNIGGQISLGKGGQWYPLHEWLLSLLAVPFYFLFGINGTLLCNMVMSFLTGFFIYKLCAEFYSPVISFFSATLTFSSSLLLHYSYSFSIDVLGVLFFTISLYMMCKKKWVMAGVWFSLTVMGRNLYVIVLPAFIFYLLFSKCKNKSLKILNFNAFLKFIFAGAPLGILFFFQNYYMFGSPFTSAYHFWIDYDPLTSQIISKSHSFDKSFYDGLSEILFSPKNSIWSGIPLLPLGIMFGVRNLITKSTALICFIFSVIFLLVIFLSVYVNSFPGSIGNRYLICVVPLSALLLCGAIERALYGESTSALSDKLSR